jgi:hypothetical protein
MMIVHDGTTKHKKWIENLESATTTRVRQKDTIRMSVLPRYYSIY